MLACGGFYRLNSIPIPQLASLKAHRIWERLRETQPEHRMGEAIGARVRTAAARRGFHRFSSHLDYLM
jgi:hypothetical protein